MPISLVSYNPDDDVTAYVDEDHALMKYAHEHPLCGAGWALYYLPRGSGHIETHYFELDDATADAMVMADVAQQWLQENGVD